MFTVLSPALDWLGSGRTKCVKGTLCLNWLYIYIYLSLSSSPSLFPFDVLSHSISFTPFSPFPRSISLSRSSFLMFFLFPIRKSFIFVRVARMFEQSPPEIFAAAARSFSFVLIWTLEFLFLFFFYASFLFFTSIVIVWS